MAVYKFLLFVLLCLSLRLPAQAFQETRTPTPPRHESTTASQTAGEPRPGSDGDALARHLSAAETYQLSGDLTGAAAENRAIIRLALGRLGAVALREGQFQRAVQLLGDSLLWGDDSQARTNLAVAHLRLSEVEKAAEQARAALTLDPKNIHARRILGKLLYAKGDYPAALAELERAIVLRPDFDAAYTLGMTYLRLKKADRAALLFEEIQAAVKSSPDLHIFFGRAYLETEFPAEAEREFRKAATLDPQSMAAHFLLGYTLLQHGGSERLPEAGRAFEQALRLRPQDFFSNFFLGVVASAENDHRTAVRYLEEAVRLNPRVGETYLFLGQSQAELGDDTAAEKNLRRAIELTSDVSQSSYQIRRAHFLLGRALIKSGRKAEGEKELARARELQGQLLESTREEIRRVFGQVVSAAQASAPGQAAAGGVQGSAAAGVGEQPPAEVSAEPALGEAEAAQYRVVKSQLSDILAQAYHNLGVIAAQQGQLPESLERFSVAAQWKPDLPGLDRNWGIINFRTGQFDKAIAPLSRQVKAHAEDALARRMLGASYYLTKNYRAAVETLKPLEAALTDDPELAYFYGVSLVQLDEHAAAAVLFERLASRHQRSAGPRFYAAQGFMMTGDYERALKEFRGVSELEPGTSQAHYNAGQSLIRLNRPEEAEREFREELRLNPADEKAKYHLAYVLLERKQQTAEALALLREALAARPDYADARYQLGKSLVEQGDLKEAIEHLEAASRVEPAKDYIRYQLSLAYRRASRIADADRELQLYRELKASNRNTESPVNPGSKQNVP
jgi:tetratricopeptide (TPR) repeat protein